MEAAQFKPRPTCHFCVWMDACEKRGTDRLTAFVRWFRLL